MKNSNSFNIGKEKKVGDLTLNLSNFNYLASDKKAANFLNFLSLNFKQLSTHTPPIKKPLNLQSSTKTLKRTIDFKNQNLSLKIDDLRGAHSLLLKNINLLKSSSRGFVRDLEHLKFTWNLDFCSIRGGLQSALSSIGSNDAVGASLKDDIGTGSHHLVAAEHVVTNSSTDCSYDKSALEYEKQKKTVGVVNTYKENLKEFKHSLDECMEKIEMWNTDHSIKENDSELINVLQTKILEDKCKSFEAKAWSIHYTNQSASGPGSDRDSIEALISAAKEEITHIHDLELQLKVKKIKAYTYKLNSEILGKLEIVIENVMRNLDSTKFLIDIVDDEIDTLNFGLSAIKSTVQILNDVLGYASEQKSNYSTYEKQDLQFLDLSIPIYSKINGLLSNTPAVASTTHREPLLQSAFDISRQPFERHQEFQDLVKNLREMLTRINSSSDTFTEEHLRFSKSRMYMDAPNSIYQSESQIEQILAGMQPDILWINENI